MLLLPCDVRVNLDELLRVVVAVFPDAQHADPAKTISRRVRLALMLRHGEQRGVPGFGAQARGVADGEA